MILIAVALFAALSYAVTQSGRSGGDVLKEERFISSAQLTQIGASLQSATTRMVLSGTPIDQVILHAAGNRFIPCTTGVNCLFAPEGGGALVPTLPQHLEKGQATMIMQMETFEIADVASVTGISDGQPLLLLVIYPISLEACRDLNKGLGIPNIPAQSIDAFASGAGPVAITQLPGKSAGCERETAWNSTTYFYYHVLATP